MRHAAQDVEGRRRPVGVEKFSRPGRQFAIGIAILRRHELLQVGKLLVVVEERIEIGGIIRGERELVLRIVLHRHRRGERQGVGALVEGCDRNAVAEHVVNPAQPHRLRRDIEAAGQHPQIMAVARAQHDAVLAERHRAVVAINGLVVDGQERHRQTIIDSGTSNLGRILLNCRSECRFDRHHLQGKRFGRRRRHNPTPQARRCSSGPRIQCRGTLAVPADLRPLRTADPARARRSRPARERTGAPHRLGHRHCRRRGGALKTSRRPSDRAALLAARHRLQPPARCRKLDPAHQRGHDDIGQRGHFARGRRDAARADLRSLPPAHRRDHRPARQRRPADGAGVAAQLYAGLCRDRAALAYRHALSPRHRICRRCC